MMARRAKDPRSEKLFVRLTHEEHEALKRLAAKEDRPVSSLVRLLLRKALGPETRMG
jgi:hypothetical protein